MQHLNPSIEIQVYLEKIDREQSYIEDRCYEIGQTRNVLDREEADLLDRHSNLDSAKKICNCTLAGAPVAIWAELQRFGL